MGILSKAQPIFKVQKIAIASATAMVSHATGRKLVIACAPFFLI